MNADACCAVKETNKVLLLSDNAKKEIDHWLTKFPADQKQSAVLAALTYVQEENGGWLTEPLMDAVADYLDMPKIAVYEAATFYSMFNLQPVGRHQINVCGSISCLLRGSEKIVEHLQNRLNIKIGETTADGKYTLAKAECLAACANAPMMRIGKNYYEDLTAEKIDQILEKLD